jgi:hypothetical protein
MSTIYTQKKTINIPFPEDKFSIYLKQSNIKTTDKFNEQNTFWLIKTCYQDFKIGKLTLDDFSSIGDYLWAQSDNKLKNSRLGSVLLNIGELNFYIRDTNPTSKFLELANFLSEIEEYFKNH